jgi:hypothetical protein
MRFDDQKKRPGGKAFAFWTLRLRARFVPSDGTNTRTTTLWAGQFIGPDRPRRAVRFFTSPWKMIVPWS